MTPSLHESRRQDDPPVLILSQDYELFFQVSGTVEKCLLEPGEMLLLAARKTGLKITLFVDAGMMWKMRELSRSHPSLDRELYKINAQLADFIKDGHEIGLHVHPHWEETVFREGEWDFSGTRYQLAQFSDAEAHDIVARYAGVLNDICDGGVKSYRAGGFCVEPFGKIRDALAGLSIVIDSSVVPGASVRDPVKGFDFSKAPDKGWWTFDTSPLEPHSNGVFTEVPVTPIDLPIWHYWGRLWDRLQKRQPKDVMGDGLSRAIGAAEIIRRLAGGGRVSELSTDAAKSAKLTESNWPSRSRKIWHVMGHPKLLSRSSLGDLQLFVRQAGIGRFATLQGLVAEVRSS